MNRTAWKKKTYTLVAAAAFLAFGATGVAFAGKGHGPMDPAKRAEHEARKAEMLKKYDANGDGKLDDAERAKKHADMAAQRFAELDTNKDGVLSKDEFAAGRHHRGHRGERGDKAGK